MVPLSTAHYFCSFACWDNIPNPLRTSSCDNGYSFILNVYMISVFGQICPWRMTYFSRVQHWTKAVREDEERLLESILKAGDKERAVAMKKHTAELLNNSYACMTNFFCVPMVCPGRLFYSKKQ